MAFGGSRLSRTQQDVSVRGGDIQTLSVSLRLVSTVPLWCNSSDRPTVLEKSYFKSTSNVHKKESYASRVFLGEWEILDRRNLWEE